MTDTYDARTIRMHWLTAALVVGLWTLGQCIDFFPKGLPRITARSLHISFGVALALLLVARLVWRVRQGVKLAPAPGLAGRLAVVMHYLLYLLLAAVVVIGIACVWIRGDNLFNLFTVPAFDPSNEDLREEAVDLHGLMANLLLFAAGLHAAAAVWHHLVIKDGVLRRMWPRLK
nr:cytochrome b/b6 domain-containing protein [uncultured Roseateles sp.]